MKETSKQKQSISAPRCKGPHQCTYGISFCINTNHLPEIWFREWLGNTSFVTKRETKRYKLKGEKTHNSTTYLQRKTATAQNFQTVRQIPQKNPQFSIHAMNINLGEKSKVNNILNSQSLQKHKSLFLYDFYSIQKNTLSRGNKETIVQTKILYICDSIKSQVILRLTKRREFTTRNLYDIPQSP